MNQIITNNYIHSPFPNFLSEMLEKIRDVTIIICLTSKICWRRSDNVLNFLTVLQKIKPQIYLQIEKSSVSKQVFSCCYAENLIREFKHLPPIPVILMFLFILIIRRSLLEVFYKKDVLKNFAKFTAYLYLNLFLNKVAGKTHILLQLK